MQLADLSQLGSSHDAGRSTDVLPGRPSLHFPEASGGAMPPADCSRPTVTRRKTTIRTARHATTGQTLPDVALDLNYSFSWTVRVSYCKFGAMTAPRTPNTAEELRGVGLRVTAARVALLETVRDGDHLGVEAIASGVRDRVGHVSLQAVYDALHALTAAGLVRRIEPAGSPARFERRVGDNHHHIVCRSCGVVADVDCAVGEAPCLTASDDHDFSIDEAQVIYWGLCPGCSTARSTGAP